MLHTLELLLNFDFYVCLHVIFQGPYFHYFGFIHAKNVNCLIFAGTGSGLHALANLDFYLCLRINFHTSSFWVLILAAGGP